MDDYYESEQYFDDREQLLHDMNAALEPVARKFVRMHQLRGKFNGGIYNEQRRICRTLVLNT